MTHQHPLHCRLALERRQQRDATREAHAELQLKFEAANQQLASLGEQLADSEALVARLGDELSELTQAMKSSRDTYTAGQRQLQQVLNSKSFRWLEPARRLRALLLPRQ